MRMNGNIFDSLSEIAFQINELSYSDNIFDADSRIDDVMYTPEIYISNERFSLLEKEIPKELVVVFRDIFTTRKQVNIGA